MKFTRLPINGASWNDELLYSFNTEHEEPTTVIVDIINSDTDELIGRQRLIGVTSGTINIAPYVQNLMHPPRTQPNLNCIIAASPSAIAVKVACNDIVSDERLFFRAPINNKRVGILSRYVDKQRMVHGGVIALTALATIGIVVEIKALYANHTTTKRHSLDANGRPMDIAISVGAEYNDAHTLVVTVICDNAIRRSMTYTLEKRVLGCRQLMWYDKGGGIETYAFQTALKVSDKAHVQSIATPTHNLNILTESTTITKLFSSFECNNELERIAEIIYSPYTFEVVGTSLQQVELHSREVEYNKHGSLHQVVVELCEHRRGGER